MIEAAGAEVAKIVAEAREAYPSSGEINFRLRDARAALAAFEKADIDKVSEAIDAFPGEVKPFA